MQIRFKNAVLLGSSGTKSIVNKAETCCWQESVQGNLNSAVIDVHGEFDKLTPVRGALVSAWF